MLSDVSEPTTTRKLPARLFLALAVLAVVVVGGGALYVWATGSDAPSIKVINPGGGSAGAEMSVPNSKAFYTDSYAVCTPTGAPVMITGLTPVGATGPVNVDWAVHRGGYSGIADGVGPIRMPGFSHQPVTGKCNPDPNAPDSFSKIALSIQAPHGGAVAVKAFTLHYNGGAVTVPFSMETCPTKHCPHYPGIS
jgi:hypothetical protein